MGKAEDSGSYDGYVCGAVWHYESPFYCSERWSAMTCVMVQWLHSRVVSWAVATFRTVQEQSLD
jgi:hypothetical protein